MDEEDFAFCHTISNEFHPQMMASLWFGSIVPLANLAILQAAEYYAATGGKFATVSNSSGGAPNGHRSVSMDPLSQQSPGRRRG